MEPTVLEPRVSPTGRRVPWAREKQCNRRCGAKRAITVGGTMLISSTSAAIGSDIRRSRCRGDCGRGETARRSQKGFSRCGKVSSRGEQPITEAPRLIIWALPRLRDFRVVDKEMIDLVWISVDQNIGHPH